MRLVSRILARLVGEEPLPPPESPALPSDREPFAAAASESLGDDILAGHFATAEVIRLVDWRRRREQGDGRWRI